MELIGDVIQRVMPAGTKPAAKQSSWSAAPSWPPDLFAVTASLASYSGVFAQSRFMAYHYPPCDVDSKYRREVIDVGERWARTGVAPDAVQRYWDELMADPNASVSYRDEDARRWLAVLKLMAIADEASTGVGFAAGGWQVAEVVLSEFRAEAEAARSRLLPWLPSSVCSAAVPPTEVCVLPKSRTPRVGCTMRSMSHNLALLPSQHEVRPNWMFGIKGGEDNRGPLNVLLIPFPYEIQASCFDGYLDPDPDHSCGFVNLKQNWLEPYEKGEKSLFEELVKPLVAQARREVGKQVNAVVFPEAALSVELADKLASDLAAEEGVEMLITGAIDMKSTPARNVAHAELFLDGKRHTRWQQPKRHRWRIDGRQIRKYQLGNALNHQVDWWEQINVSNRNCFFYVYRSGASMAVFVCEDLARLDAVQTVVRAVGPNLVIALLMDDVQIERRWPGQYATVLADDPGSAVLTFTSLGLVRRAQMPAGKGANIVALWKEPSGVTRELELPPDAHALLLTLSHGREIGHTSDGRSDEGTSVEISLTGVVGIKRASTA